MECSEETFYRPREIVLEYEAFGLNCEYKKTPLFFFFKLLSFGE